MVHKIFEKEYSISLIFAVMGITRVRKVYLNSLKFHLKNNEKFSLILKLRFTTFFRYKV